MPSGTAEAQDTGRTLTSWSFPLRLLIPPSRVSATLVSVAGLATLATAWQLTANADAAHLLPGLAAIARALVQLVKEGALVRYVVASLFRVGWGFTIAAVCGMTFGLLTGISRRAEYSLLSFVHILRPISALAWIPIAILWFGVGDVAAIFVIAIASVSPIALQTFEAVRAVPQVYVRVGRNFGWDRFSLIRDVMLPAATPDILTALRVTLGIAWMVDVAAEMLAVNSGLGFLIVDARNAGNRYDLVLAGIMAIGIIGLSLDVVVRSVQRRVAWSH
jgi:NitT/TauT family transport system permease protein